MPGLITPYLPEPDAPRKPRKAAAIVAAVLTLLVAAPVAGAGVGSDVPNPGWEVD